MRCSRYVNVGRILAGVVGVIKCQSRSSGLALPTIFNNNDNGCKTK